MGCLGDDNMVRDVTIEEMSQAVFSASPLGVLGGYINRLAEAVQPVQCSGKLRMWRLGEWKTYERSVCAVEKRIGTSAVRLRATTVNWECRLGQRRLV
jgi:hypothetical protein